jgi:Xaa-Pro aminopeptidase
MTPRLQKLRQKIAEKGLDALFVSQTENRRYLSGFTGTAGFLLISQHQAILATDFRYTQQASLQAPDFQIFQTRGNLDDWVSALFFEANVKTVGFEATDLSFFSYQRFAEAIRKINKGIEIVPTEGIVESLRAVKDSEELYNISAAARLVDAVFEHCLSVIRRGITERELAWEMESYMREEGGEPPSFEFIVASGENAAMPHHRPTDRRIQLGEPVLIDIGACMYGYHSDLSRTTCLERQDRTYDKVYNIVLEAQLAAIQQIEAGKPASEIDRHAREIIARAGYGEAFGHGLGHGIGLGTHEEPRLSPYSNAILEENMVFTVEPGIYIQGWGGVRIEDMVVIEKGKARVLTSSRK